MKNRDSERTVRGGLLSNEMIKINRQTGFRAVMIVVLVIGMILALIMSAVTASLHLDDSLEDKQKAYLDEAEEFRDLAARTSGDSSRNFSLMAKYSEICAESMGYFIDNDNPEWKYKHYFDLYNNARARLYAAEAICDYTYTVNELMSSDFGPVLKAEGQFSTAVYVSDPEFNCFMRIDSEGTYVRISDTEFLELVREEVKAVTSYIEVADFSYELARMLNEAVAQLVSTNETLAEYKTQIDAGSRDSELKYAYDKAVLKAEGQEMLVEAYRWLYDNNVAYGSWQLKTVTDGMDSAAYDLGNHAVPDRQLFEQMGLAKSYEYERYAASREKSAEEARTALRVFRYSLENDIPTPQMASKPVRELVKIGISYIRGLILIVCVVLAGTTVANEFSSGTVRLLLTHPRKRRRVLTSKIFSVLIWTAGLYAAVALEFVLVSSVVLRGVGDLFVPDLYCVGGTVFSLPGIVRIVEALAFGLLPALLCASLALLFACLTGKAAFSVALPLVINMMSGTVSMFARTLAEILPWLCFTILPYFNMSPFVHDPTAAYSRIEVLSEIFGSSSVSYGLDAWAGVAIFALHIGAVVVLSYVSFTKRQIKS